jgi:hypothetical protein
MPDETPNPGHPAFAPRPPTPPGTHPFGTPVPPPVPGTPYAPGGPATKKKRHPVLTHGGVALVALFLGVGIGAAGGGSSDGTPSAHVTKAAARPAPTVTVTAKPKPARTVTVTAKPKPTHKAAAHKAAKKAGAAATSAAGDGEYRVGKDIAAGTYRTAGPQDSLGCYWERDKDSSGDFGSIIANDNLNGSGLVTVRTGEIFKTERCKTWKRVG